MSAIGICDRDGIYGLPRAEQQSKETGPRLIVGAELTLEHEGAPHGSIALLAKDATGYRSLCRLLTIAHRDHEKGTAGITIERVAESAAGLIAVAPLDRALVQDGDAVFAAMRDAFGDDAFVAAFRHREPFDVPRVHAAERIEARFGVPVIASARPLYHDPSRRPLADVLACIRLGTTLDQAGTRIAPNAQRYLRSDAEMRALFADHLSWVDRTSEIAARCTFRLSDIRYRFPGEIACRPGETADDALRRCAEAGVRKYYPSGASSSVRETIEKELALIARLGVAPYFLSVREIVEMARAKGILCQGRGSAANSAVCYVLGVTSVDPDRTHMLFERFLSAERAEPPDIDVDFEHERREEVIQEIYATWGRERAAMVSEAICYRGRSALREVGKAFGLAKDELDRLSGLVLHLDPEGLRSRTGGEARLREVGLDPSDARLVQVLMLAAEIEGMPRHLSIHSGGFILSSEPLESVAPIEPARMKDRTVIPWDKDDLDALGFFKVDVLGLGMLTAIRKALELVHATAGETFDPIFALAQIPKEDPVVYDAIQRADTIGVFQIESRAQMAMLPRLKPANFYDLVIEVAIVRPGPIQGNMVHPYLRRRTGVEKNVSPHPCLEPILARTLGVPLFQEQVMEIAMKGAGYSADEADGLRRDMASWRRNGRLARHRDKLLVGFRARGIDDEFAERLYQQIHGFAEYGFPESHAASFAILVYASSWLKVHHPAAFACALLNSQPMGFYSTSSIVQDAQRHDVQVLAPDVSHSDWGSTLEGMPRSLRLGLREIRGLGEADASRIAIARRERSFASVEDLVTRAHVVQRDLEALAEAGALASLLSERRHAMWASRAPRAPGLFEGVTIEDAPSLTLAPMPRYQQLVLDYERLGLSIDDHPMRHVRAEMKKKSVVTAENVMRLAHGTRVVVAGLVIGRQRPDTKTGVTFITLEDETGVANLVVWRQVFDAHWRIARHATAMIVRGTIQREGAVVHVVTHGIEPLTFDSIAVKSRDFH
jgi:error-prone DNA polymerase